MREEAASEAAIANKDDGGEDGKADNKQTKSCPSNLLASQDKSSQETADVTLTDLPKKSKVTELKNEPKSSSHGNVHMSP